MMMMMFAIIIMTMCIYTLYYIAIRIFSLQKHHKTRSREEEVPLFLIF